MFTPRRRTHLEGTHAAPPQWRSARAPSARNSTNTSSASLPHGHVSLMARPSRPAAGSYSHQKLSPEKRTTLRAILATRCHDGVPIGSRVLVDAWEEKVRILADGTHKLVIDPWYTKTGVAVTVIF